MKKNEDVSDGVIGKCVASLNAGVDNLDANCVGRLARARQLAVEVSGSGDRLIFGSVLAISPLRFAAILVVIAALWFIASDFARVDTPDGVVVFESSGDMPPEFYSWALEQNK